MSWRRLLRVRSVAEVEQWWDASKTDMPGYVAAARSLHKAKVAAYNAEKAFDSLVNGPRSEPAAQVAFVVTRATKQQLVDMGYTLAAVKDMKPDVAMAVVDDNVPPQDFDEWLQCRADAAAAALAEAEAGEVTAETVAAPDAGHSSSGSSGGAQPPVAADDVAAVGPVAAAPTDVVVTDVVAHSRPDDDGSPLGSGVVSASVAVAVVVEDSGTVDADAGDDAHTAGAGGPAPGRPA